MKQRWNGSKLAEFWTLSNDKKGSAKERGAIRQCRGESLPLRPACRTAFNSCSGTGVGTDTRAEMKISPAFGHGECQKVGAIR